MFTVKAKRCLRLLAMLVALTLTVTPLTACNSKQEKYPSRPISMIVPFNPGGATDLIGRALAAKMQEKLGSDITVTNMPGGATAVGNQFVLDAEHDGYTILVQPTDITSIGVMGQADISYRDWTMIGVAAAVPAIFVVSPDSPYQTVEDLVAAMKSGTLSVSVADNGCAWSRATGLLAQTTGGNMPELVPMGGGGPAAISAMKKEVDVGSCGLPESVEFLTGGKLRALAYWGAEDLEVEGYGTIPSIGNALPELKAYLPYGGWVGMSVPKDTPADIVKIIIEAYEFAIASDDFKNYLNESRFVEVGLSGDKATEYVATSESLNAWLLYDLGFAAKNPDDLGIPKAN